MSGSHASTFRKQTTTGVSASGGFDKRCGKYYQIITRTNTERFEVLAPLCVGGILWLLFSRAAQAFRFLGVTYLLYLPLMMILHAKDYYLAAISPQYSAAGRAAWIFSSARPGCGACSRPFTWR